MTSFSDEAGAEWVATVREEVTPRHHGRWYLVFHPADEPERILPVPEIRWQTVETARRTLETMGLMELRRRLGIARARHGSAVPARADRPAGA